MKRLLNWLFNQKHKIEYVKLKTPDDSIEYFEDLKIKSESYWEETDLNPNIYGLQIQKNTKWNNGLSEEEIEQFQEDIKIKFPKSLKNFYRVMNGVDLPSVNIYGKNGEEKTYNHSFYSYPRDLGKIKQLIDWIYEANNVSNSDIEEKGISKIFPIYSHRFMLINEKVILSMYGTDILFYADNISKLLGNEIFANIDNVWDFESNPNNCPEIKFWLNNKG